MSNFIAALFLVLGLSLAAFSAEIADRATFSSRTELGYYDIEIEPIEEIEIGVIQAWKMVLAQADGSPFVPKQFMLYGGMPEHRHGLPTQPMVTQQISVGEYLVEGVLFNMYGSWEIVIGVVGPNGPDKATFELTLDSKIQSSGVAVNQWNDFEWQIIQSLAISGEETPRKDASNRFDGSPAAIALGESLFFDQNLSRSGDVSCETCHKAELAFTDGLRLSKGSKELARNSPTLLGLSHADWFYWDGRRDSLWAQALTPIETKGEMDNSRTAVVRYVLENDDYRQAYSRIVGNLPQTDRLPNAAGPFGTETERESWNKMSGADQRMVNQVFSNIGKIIASYVAKLEPGMSRFDKYVNAIQSGNREVAENILKPSEINGLKLFLDSGKTACLRCHNGPYLTNFGFHNIGTGIDADGNRDFGRMIGLRAASVDPFKCGGAFSDVPAAECGKHRFAITEHGDDGAFKVPSLRNVARTGPYMHDGRFANLYEVLEFYREPPPALDLGHELPPLNLTESETDNLVRFLHALTDDSN